MRGDLFVRIKLCAIISSVVMNQLCCCILFWCICICICISSSSICSSKWIHHSSLLFSSFGCLCFCSSSYSCCLCLYSWACWSVIISMICLKEGLSPFTAPWQIQSLFTKVMGVAQVKILPSEGIFTNWSCKSSSGSRFSPWSIILICIIKIQRRQCTKKNFPLVFLVVFILLRVIGVKSLFLWTCSTLWLLIDQLSNLLGPSHSRQREGCFDLF